MALTPASSRGGSLPSFMTADTTPGAELLTIDATVAVNSPIDQDVLVLTPGGDDWNAVIRIDQGDSAVLGGDASLLVSEDTTELELVVIDAYAALRLRPQTFAGVIQAGAGVSTYFSSSAGVPAENYLANGAGVQVVTDATGVGFFAAAPVAQPAAVANAAGGAIVDAEARAALNALLAHVRALGLIAT